ncbi:MAG: hypothetical protein HY473_00580 [Candidatus Sungbacteria bacterium]|uniref:Uncharacterized protein n=1 Tax=Candidatus Sungiibacteriota bacterium TaxID=2750080 RepID=A0A933DU40_9BACT|nr:hypothetical protein [Candidatus Sungbacteria bacterium]
MTAIFLVTAIRFLVPFSILRWPFWGALASIAADAADIVLVEALGAEFGSAARYQVFDKFFDIYYLSFEAYVSLRWQDTLARRTSMVLFAWRLAGFAAFELTRIRQVIFFAPNIFENFYLLVAGARQFFPSFRLDNPKKLTAFLLVAAIPKIAQEYIMHFLEFPTWAFIKHNVLRWR